MGKTGLSVRGMDYTHARQVFERYQENSEYLRDLIRNHGVPKSINTKEFSDLLRYGRTIRGIAHKVLMDQPIEGVDSDYKKTILGNIQAMLDARGSELDGIHERVCIQLEDARVPEDHFLSLMYERAKARLIL